ncbi:MAG: S8 family serine peptidase [Phycisphaerales bacterium]|nr:MAG: S8 family serine peptidase [Phycisphaerales bacterium]
MYTEKVGPLRRIHLAGQSQVIVKLKTSRPARRVLHAAATEGRRPAKKGMLERWLDSKKVAALEPIFGEAPRRGVETFRRMAVAAETEVESALAGLNVLSMSSQKDAQKAREQITRDPLVEYAYVPPEKYVLLPARGARSQDPMVNRQWGLRAIQLFQAEQMASFPDARRVVIAIIDSGIDPNHPDLQGILLEERSFTSGAKKDTSGHGTHVAGIIAAVRNNRIGIRGVCSSQKIMSLKALDPYSATGYYRAIRHATDDGAQVLNLSLGGGYDPTEETLIKRAMSKGLVVVAAMGNEKQQGNPKSYPGSIGGVIAVGASTETDGIASFSNTGSHIDLVAPGVNVLSTVPTYPTSLADGTDYEAWPGTSMATPHVAAAAGILLAKRPKATVRQVRQALVRGADKVPGQTRFNTTFGHGRLNVREALRKI